MKALEAAALVAPTLREDLSSKSFVEGVIVPTVLELLQNPTKLPDSAGLATEFVSMFVKRFVGEGDTDATLSRVFKTDRALLNRAFETFFETLKVSLAGSERWRDLVHQQTSEATYRNSREMLRLIHERMPEPISTLSHASALAEAQRACTDLLEWPRDIFGAQIERAEFSALETRIVQEPSGTTLLVGEAGSGKSALLSSLTQALQDKGFAVLALKADQLPAEVRTLNDVAEALGMDQSIEATLRRLTTEGPAVLIIDQLDAVSDVMDRQSMRMRLLLRLVASLRPPSLLAPFPVHVIVSSRPFEADHDARFQQLNATRLHLHLPSRQQVDSLLTALGLEPAMIPQALAETVRRPFALKLFVDLVRRGATIDDLIPGQLLIRWLSTADLGAAPMRERVISLLTDLANEMIATETLWRPADRFELLESDALGRAEAAGLILRDERGQISFSHQSWLDDFQAKGFTNGRALAEYAWSGQDSLFPRASVLRGLQRLRSVDVTAYLVAIDLLLGEAQTRRHLKYLVVDLIGTVDPPLPREAAWALQLLQEDVVLARRLLIRIARAWPVWRAWILSSMPLMMAMTEYQWVSSTLLAEEAKLDAGAVMDLVDRHWATAEADGLVLRMIELSGLWTERMRNRTADAMERSPPAEHHLSKMMQEFLDAEKKEEALDLVALFFETGSLDQRLQIRIYKLETLAEAIPEAFAERLFERFVAFAASDLLCNGSRREVFDRSNALQWDWKDVGGLGAFFEALLLALRLCAERAPGRLIRLMAPFFAVEIDQVQTTIADALAAGGAALATEGLDFLATDARRLQLGDAMGEDPDGTGHMIQGWSSQQLVRAIVPGLSDDQLLALRDVIEAWSLYPPDVFAEASPADRRLFRQFAEEARLPLLEALPAAVVGARRRRQIDEWRRDQPRISRVGARMMARLVGSPMSKEAMERATDDQVMEMLDTVHDRSDDHFLRRRGRSGGVRQLSQAFGTFAAARPAMVFALVENRLVPDRHSQSAGEAIRELAKADALEPDQVRGLIHRLHGRGFENTEWRNDAAWAFSSLAERRGGLESDDIALIESWLVRDPERIADQVERRKQLQSRNVARNDPEPTKKPSPMPTLFGGFGGMHILPQKNYSFLAAIADGLLRRPDPDSAAWVSVMERHVDDPEDPEIWEALLLRYANPLFWVEPDRARTFFDRILSRHPLAFASPVMVGLIWKMRSLITQPTMQAIIGQWLGGDDIQRQAAGELVAGIAIVDQSDDVVADLSQTGILSGPSPTRLGCVFSASAAWREDSAELRKAGHTVLMAVGPSLDTVEAEALTRAIIQKSTVPADRLTRELLSLIRSHRVLLSAAIGTRLLDTLQALLLYPGFDNDVLAVARSLSDLISERDHRGLVDGDLVQIAVALQRNDGPIRAAAMDVYERLLDAQAYGAAEAAEAALDRSR